MPNFDVTIIDMTTETTACAVLNQWDLASRIADSLGNSREWIRVFDNNNQLLLDLWPSAPLGSEAYKLGIICGLNRDTGLSLQSVSARLPIEELAAFERGFYQAHIII